MKQDKSKVAQPFISLLLLIACLGILSLFNSRLDVWGLQTKPIEPFSEILLSGAVSKAPLPGSIINDSIIAKDSMAFAMRRLDPTNIVDFKKGSTTTLASFFESLKATKQGKGQTRIAYFGDSMIEGDLISQDLRALMQDEFGGNGVGYVPITSIVSYFRKSIKHKFKGWTTYKFFSQKPERHGLGISGYGFVPTDIQDFKYSDKTSNSWVKYSAPSSKHLDRFYNTKLIYGKGSKHNSVIINNKQYLLDGKAEVNQITHVNDNDSLVVDAYFKCKKPMDIYGFSFESERGVLVDNYSFRGNSGLPNYRVKKAIYSGTNTCLNYDLIILQYGLNALNPNTTTYSWYRIGMTKVINHIKESFPGVSILLISVGDKGYNKNGKFQTDPSAPLLLATQKRLAKDNELAFWSLYDAMGGYGSMVKWVEGDTVYAKKDYAHFNHRGASRVGKMLFEKLLSEYKDYYKSYATN